MGDLVLFLPFLALFGVIIYMQTRQRKKIQARQEQLQAALSVGAPIMLTCGLYGDVASMDETTVDVEIAPGVISTFARAAVLEVRSSESTFVDDDDADIDDAADTVSADNADSADTRGADNRSADDADRDTATAKPAKPLARDDPSA